MSLASTRASSLTRTSPRSHFAKFALKTSKVLVAHSRDTGFHGVPVGRTQRNGSTNASSTGPCSPCTFRSPEFAFEERVHDDPVFTKDGLAPALIVRPSMLNAPAAASSSRRLTFLVVNVSVLPPWLRCASTSARAYVLSRPVTVSHQALLNLVV